LPNNICFALAVSSLAKFIYPGPISAVFASPGVPPTLAAVKLPLVITPSTERAFDGAVMPIPTFPPFKRVNCSLFPPLIKRNPVV